MAIVRLPAKMDYWTTELWMPVHTVTKANNLSHNCFKFLWKHFHVSEEVMEANVMEENGNDSFVETITEVGLERVQIEEEEDAQYEKMMMRT